MNDILKNFGCILKDINNFQKYYDQMGTKMNYPNYLNDQQSFYPLINNHNYGLRYQNSKPFSQNCKNVYNSSNLKIYLLKLKEQLQTCKTENLTQNNLRKNILKKF